MSSIRIRFIFLRRLEMFDMMIHGLKDVVIFTVDAGFCVYFYVHYDN